MRSPDCAREAQGGQRGSDTGGDTAVTPEALVCLCLAGNSPASPAARDKVGVCCPPDPPASRQGSGGRRWQPGDPGAAGYSPSRVVPGPGRASLGKWYPAGPGAPGGDAGLGSGPSTPRTRTAFALVVARGGRGSQSAAPRPPARTCRAQHPFGGSPGRRRVPGRVLRPR